MTTFTRLTCTVPGSSVTIDVPDGDLVLTIEGFVKPSVAEWVTLTAQAVEPSQGQVEPARTVYAYVTLRTQMSGTPTTDPDATIVVDPANGTCTCDIICDGVRFSFVKVTATE